MKMRLFFLLMAIMYTSLTFAQKQRKTVFIIVDGIAADVVESMNLPNISRISKEGAFKRMNVGGLKGTYNETPTISAVGYNSVLTGTWVNKHNVWNNSIKEPNYNYATIFRLFKDAYPDKKTAIYSTWLDNRMKLSGHGLAQTNNFEVDYYFDGLELDTVQYPHDANSNYIHKIDEAVTTKAVQSIKTIAPDLTWVYLQYTDDMGHKFGDSPEFEKAVKIADAQIGRLYDAVQLRAKKNNEDWLFIVTTDHGRDAATGKHHGGQTYREKSGWVLINRNKELNNYIRIAIPQIVDIMPTISNFMNIKIPQNQLREIDGISMFGNISVANAAALLDKEGELRISWEAFNKEGNVKIWLAKTNHFKNGKEDVYELIGEIPATQQKFISKEKFSKNDTLKIVIEGLHTSVNCWVVPQ